jgi:hypothetical protein
VIATMAVPVRKVETQRLQQMQMLAYPGHRHIEEPGWFLQAQRRGADRRRAIAAASASVAARVLNPVVSAIEYSVTS